jgi:hypothetical protein
MTEFAAKSGSSLTIWIPLLLARGATWILPALTLIQQGEQDARFFVVPLGLVDGFIRLRASRSARSLDATRDGLVIAAGLGSTSVAWVDVLGIQTSRNVGDVHNVAVHYRTARGGNIATCWEQFEGAELKSFVMACGAYVNQHSVRAKITLFGVEARPVWSSLANRFAQDVAIATCFALVLGPALLPLGIVAALASACVACLRYPPGKSYILTERVWWRETSRGPRRLKVIPPSLRLWVDALSRSSP